MSDFMNNSDPLAKEIIEYSKSLVDALLFEKEHGNLIGFNEGKAKIFNKQSRSIRFQLMKNPGLLIYFEDENKRKPYECAINFVWGNLESEINDYENIYHMLKDSPGILSEYSDIDDETVVDFAEILYEIDSAYLDKANKLRPTFISVEPENTEFYSLYQEAMKAWLFGLNVATVNLCWAIIENLFRERLTSINKIAELYYQKDFIRKLVDKTHEENLINGEQKKIAHRIRYLRNHAKHDLKKISEDEIYNIIQQTKDIAEHILKSNF